MSARGKARRAAERPPIVQGISDSRLPPEAFGRHAGLGLGVAGGVLLLGTLVDLAVLWVLQREPGLQWEFVAISSTTDAYPRLVLSIGLLYGALSAARSTRLGAYRVLGGALVGLGIAAAGLGALMVTNYFALSGSVQPAAARAFRSTAIKALGLCALYVVALVPVGLLSLRRPRG